ncbi:inclusion membrane protein GarD [Chlamydia vaughanii]|uniref:inclusion membrane protein GarD n=1 Tax=Chlamydia vaughanii TaxID=3112552 RepID=UPI0032B16154
MTIRADSLKNQVFLSNSLVRKTMLNFVDPGEHKLITFSSESGIDRFLNQEAVATSRGISRFAQASGVIIPTDDSPSVPTIVAIEGMNLGCHCLEQLCWMSFIVRMFNCVSGGAGNERSEFVIGAIAIGILLSICLIVFGSSIASAVTSAIKVSEASKEIRGLERSNQFILEKLHETTESSIETTRAKTAAVTTMQANCHTISAYKHYRATRIAFLVSALICSIGLFALAVAAILGIFFAAPGGSVAIASAIIGCCAGGGAVLGLGCLGFLVTSVHTMVKKQKQVMAELKRAVLCSMVSDLITNNPGEYENSAISQSIARSCVANIVDTSLLKHAEGVVLTGYSNREHRHEEYDRPPPYNPYEYLPPSYEETIRRQS